MRMERLVLLGLNHTTAPVQVREKVAFGPDQTRAALSAMRDKFPQAEVVLLSTCNRVEFYVCRAVHGHPRTEEIRAFLSEFHSLPMDEMTPHLYEKNDREAIEHLFTVASSLDSMVLGETQILGQVRDAYELASASQTAGPLLHPLFQRAIAVGSASPASRWITPSAFSISSTIKRFCASAGGR
jgi:glutamyl-tRNA reductase